MLQTLVDTIAGPDRDSANEMVQNFLVGETVSLYILQISLRFPLMKLFYHMQAAIQVTEEYFKRCKEFSGNFLLPGPSMHGVHAISSPTLRHPQVLQSTQSTRRPPLPFPHRCPNMRNSQNERESRVPLKRKCWGCSRLETKYTNPTLALSSMTSSSHIMQPGGRLKPVVSRQTNSQSITSGSSGGRTSAALRLTPHHC